MKEKTFKEAFWCGNELKRDNAARDLKFSHACGFSSQPKFALNNSS